ncbi:uncharacterized protein BKA55DRAFT_559442 [Fusarium redolens]|uniref:Uncharacterized protein n=1 Tax=Fusarium redolens TaxID=48865 RepID=A0A9P9HYJ2_FUSRE|nr:uncharacterized protein BKA55DRAFT_559442 [Fusarium redolens]KAH7265726.1 hypothetical protein BKA55DRAFT_559442 [Fusarium redolens]
MRDVIYKEIDFLQPCFNNEYVDYSIFNADQFTQECKNCKKLHSCFLRENITKLYTAILWLVLRDLE